MPEDKILQRLDWAQNRSRRIKERLIEMRDLPLDQCDLFEIRAHVGDAGGFGLFLRDNSSALTEVALRFADCVHQIRCALDHLVFQDVASFLEPKQKNNLSFPRQLKRKNDAFRLIKKHAPTKLNRVKALFQSRPEYAGRLDALCATDNDDKHRYQVSLATEVGAPYFCFDANLGLCFRNEPREGALFSEDSRADFEKIKQTVIIFIDFKADQALVEEGTSLSSKGSEALVQWDEMARAIHLAWTGSQPMS